MTIKDLADMTVKFGLVCQKSVPLPFLLWSLSLTHMFEVYRQQVRPSQRTSGLTCNVVTSRKINPFSSATVSPALPPMTNCYLHSIRALVAPTVMSVPTIG